jgi:lipid A 3-O-deacylase
MNIIREHCSVASSRSAPADAIAGPQLKYTFTFLPSTTMRLRTIIASVCHASWMMSLIHSGHALAQHPADQWEMAVEAGYLKKVKHNSPLNYVIAPAQVVWRSPPLFDIWNGDSGARLTVRNRFSILAETFVKGAEDYYFGIAGSPTFELWSADQKKALFYEIGGGAGFVNSKGVPGGQGQDFTFNWFTQLGVRYQLSRTLGVTGGTYFLHHSNLGMTKPNPGIDVLGVNFGLVWHID